MSFAKARNVVNLFTKPKNLYEMGTIRQGIAHRPVSGGGNKLYAIGLHYSRISDTERRGGYCVAAGRILDWKM